MNETRDTSFPTSSSMGSSSVGGSSPGASSLGSTGTGAGSTASSGGTGSSVDSQDKVQKMAQKAHQAVDDSQGTVQKMAQKAHEAVDKLEQTLGSSGDRMMSWQNEYGDMARDQVRSNPIAAIGIAFGVGILFSKLFMR